MFISCTNTQHKSVISKGIQDSDKKEIHKLLPTVLDNFRTHDTSAANEIISKNAVKIGTIDNTYFTRLSEIRPGVQLKVIKEWEISAENTDTVFLIDSVNNYTFRFHPLGSENYVSIFSIQSTYDDLEYLLCTIFNKEDSKWKLSSITVGLYKQRNKDAGAYCGISKEQYKKGDFLGAYLRIQEANWLMYPGRDKITYHLQQDFFDFRKHTYIKVLQQCHLMRTMGEISSAPVLLDFEVILDKGRFVPYVKYASAISFSDTLKFKNEYADVSSYIVKTFPSLKDISPDLIYQIYKKGDENSKTNYVNFIYHF